MAILKLAFILFALMFVNGILAQKTEENEVFYDTQMVQGVKVYRNDRECAMLGGLCVHRSDCLETSSKSGLCPSNKHLGVECCYELPVRPAPCREHLGQCRDRCPARLVRPGIDCKDGQFCCVLV